jgi:hypothetical protein
MHLQSKFGGVGHGSDEALYAALRDRVGDVISDALPKRRRHEYRHGRRAAGLGSKEMQHGSIRAVKLDLWRIHNFDYTNRRWLRHLLPP